MLSEESRRKIRELKIDDLIDILDDQEQRPDVYASLSFDDRLSLAIDELYLRKNNSRAKRLISAAKLRYPSADINTLILEPRKLNKNRMLALASESYQMEARNIIINGYTGAGKTFLACAIAKEACRHLHKTRYIRLPKLLEDFNLATQTGVGISKLVKRYSNYHMLIIDEWLVEIPSEMEVKYLLEIFETRYDLHPTIFCTQYRQAEWHPRLGGGVMADAIMDRIVHNADTVDLGKVNMRELLARKSD
ncbi:MAG: ATP-binding protein [Lachnospiraceae bacterium]|nr:ATP-binding protein [Lachnospiraceae bacterium]